MRFSFPWLFFLLALFFSGCASAPQGRIAETEGGSLEAIGTARDEPNARIAALDEATIYCSERKQKPVFRDDEIRNANRSKKFDLDLHNLPVIGKAFKGEDTTQVILGFRCNLKSI